MTVRVYFLNYIAFVASFLLTFRHPFQAQAAKPARQPQSLAAMRDRYRPLLIFSPDSDTRASEQKEALIPYRKELLDRQLMLVVFFHKYAGAWDQDIEINLVPEEAALRRRFHVQSNVFTVILIGKDGGEKFRSNIPITIQQLNRLIDAMPMRQQEMRSLHTP